MDNRISHRVSRRRFLGLGAAAGSFLLAGCSGDDEEPPPSTSTADAGIGAEPSPEGPTPSPSPTATLDEKIGEMLMVGFRGQTLEPSEPLTKRLQNGLTGSIVLFDYDVPSEGSFGRNIGSPEQVMALNEQLQSLAPRKLLIAADQEGGYVARLSPKRGFPPTYSAQELGTRNDLEFTREQAAMMARTLAKAGINLNLAPVLDLNVNPSNPIIGDIERSFSADPAIVTRNALAFIQAHHDAGVLTTLKHFPGHGSSKDDSHLGFVDVTGLWTRKELEPFRNVIQAGMADVIMTAHIFNSEWDKDVPATLSKNVITGILREELGYDGVVVTDDMQMGAIRQYYGFDAAIEMAVNAGADMIALSNNGDVYNPNLAEDGFMAIRRAVTAGRISEARVNEAYERIIQLKSRLG